MPMYEIRVKGHLDERWSTWFDGLTIKHEANGNTIIAGSVVDQSALHSLLMKIHTLNLTLLTVSRIETDVAC
ncbi:MAG TPA: hypothetical protein VFA10_23125 [Ktedonobacteraceae bacterium]|jgi:hypothetical protein|nr:hypothetical protein [Ktedonobacteraceae bacterium]